LCVKSGKILRMKTFYLDLKSFFEGVWQDERLPLQDKKILLVLLALIVSPIDFIPDWVPLYGLVDDLICLALISDYLFNVIDQQLLLSHYPWGMKSFARIRRIAGILSIFVPNFIANNLWKYVREPY
jgi:uncharacterized membrane protein YkvA (DUF1232 family)